MPRNRGCAGPIGRRDSGWLFHFFALRNLLTALQSGARVSALENAIIDELVAVLGVEKAKNTANTLFRESDPVIETQYAFTFGASSILHKLRGGAALLGL